MKRTVVIHSPNWLGDVVMALPGFRRWRQANADAAVYVLAKRNVEKFWNYVRDVDAVIQVGESFAQMRHAAHLIRRAVCNEAIVLPNSFRSALQVWLGGVSAIRGVGGQFRSMFITDEVDLSDLSEAHQAFEYMRILGVDFATKCDVASLPSPSEAVDISRLPPLPTKWDYLRDSLVILPGAQRGDSKRWPAENFAAVGKAVLFGARKTRVVVCGTHDEAEVCRAVADAIGEGAVNLCGKTSLPELSRIVSCSRAVCCNDSGGMHLATAMGRPVVAIFGMTDASKTGPLGLSCVVAAKGVSVSRSIPRETAAAAAALQSVDYREVLAALEAFL